MPPNTGSGRILDQFECSYKQAANPYSDTKHACFEKCPGTSGSAGTREHETPEPAVDDTVRVTTRARLTYELYNYSKNAMLIVTTTYNNYERNLDIMEMKTTFEKFRFEVEVVNIELDNVELYEKCGQFLRRDFTEYGAVALVLLLPMQAMRANYSYVSIPGFKCRALQEPIILDNFRPERNPTLAEKPKIYITELDRGFLTALYDTFGAVEHATHGDVIGFHCGAFDGGINRSIYKKYSSPMAEWNGPVVAFCKKLAAMGDNVALPEIIMQTMKDDDENSSILSPFFKRLKTPTVIVNTLSKELYFARTEE